MEPTEKAYQKLFLEEKMPQLAENFCPRARHRLIKTLRQINPHQFQGQRDTLILPENGVPLSSPMKHFYGSNSHINRPLFIHSASYHCSSSRDVSNQIYGLQRSHLPWQRSSLEPTSARLNDAQRSKEAGRLYLTTVRKAPPYVGTELAAPMATLLP